MKKFYETPELDVSYLMNRSRISLDPPVGGDDNEDFDDDEFGENWPSLS